MMDDAIQKLYFELKNSGKLQIFNQCQNIICVFKEIVPDNLKFREQEKDVNLSFYMSFVDGKFPFLHRRVVSEFKDKKDLVEYGTGACHIPLIAGGRLFRETQDYLCCDGFTYKKIKDSSILVAPYWFMGYSKYYTIKPSVSLPFLWSIIAPDNSIILDIYELGYYDTKFFIRQNINLFEDRVRKCAKDEFIKKIVSDDYICQRSYHRVKHNLKNSRLIYYCNMCVILIFIFCAIFPIVSDIYHVYQ